MRSSREHLSSLGLVMARSIYMPEMTNLQVREYLEGGGRTVLVPVGSTEDHGDHGPLWTDVYIPLEVCKRAAAGARRVGRAADRLRPGAGPSRRAAGSSTSGSRRSSRCSGTSA